MGQYDRALPMYEECLAERKRILGDDQPDTLASLNNLAGLFESMGQYDRALPMYEECLAERKRILSHDHPKTKETVTNHRRCASKIVCSAIVESSMQLIDASLLLNASKQRVRNRLCLIAPKKSVSRLRGGRFVVFDRRSKASRKRI
jgi:hypothetical protein